MVVYHACSLKKLLKYRESEEKSMDNELIKSISKMIANGNRLELPKDEQLPNYAQVKKALIKAGGEYKKCGFNFPGSAADIQGRLTGGEVIDDKKKYQFFATPHGLAEELVRMADISPGHACLEPSAGQGAISDLILKEAGSCTVIELMPENARTLREKGYHPIEGDFLKQGTESLGLFDRIVANPPFTKNQDIAHIRHMYQMLKPGGKLISVASKSWTFGCQKKQVSFRILLNNIGATISEIPEVTFKESGTSVGAVIVEINLPV